MNIENELNKIGDKVIDELNYCFKYIEFDFPSHKIDKLNNNYDFKFYIKKLNISGEMHPHLNIIKNKTDIDLNRKYIFIQCYNHILDCITSYFLKGDFRNYEELQ